jgi:ubiquinone biosynthesis protein COQ9
MTDEKKPRAKKNAPRDDAALKTAVLEAALAHVPAEGFTEAVLKHAAEEAGADKPAMARLFPDGPPSLIDVFFASVDSEMETRLARAKLPALKIRERITKAVETRLDILRPNKEAARRASAFLTLPPHAALGARLLYRSVDSMWRAAGDTSTDFNFYTKRAILAGVYTSTLVRWFNDDSEDETATREFLAARIENVMQFERFKAEVKERVSGVPSLSEILNSLSARRS